jgi:hypothetical protein|mmetsp:Transcript_43715/g.57936  ORF Transcript_43715/g.57936 Transcript_43715/m.57936 type:complete len:152 (+) Transcript_43715:1471-1926(+)
MDTRQVIEAEEHDPYHPDMHMQDPYHPDMHFSTYHPTHPSLDHAHDDQHDVEPVHFHEHAVLKSFDHPDAHDYYDTKELERIHEYERRSVSDHHGEASHHSAPVDQLQYHFPTFEEARHEQALQHPTSYHHQVESPEGTHEGMTHHTLEPL